MGSRFFGRGREMGSRFFGRGREMGSRLDEEDSVAVAERVKRRWQGVLIVESLLPHNYRVQISDEL
jgi:hypothetical protein